MRDKTQMYYARRGEITQEMSYVARIEGLSENLVMDEVAKGSIIIPANINHKNLTNILYQLVFYYLNNFL